MASVETSAYQGRYLKLTVVEESTSVQNNTSTVRWTLESIGGTSTYYTIFNCKVVVNGQVVYNPGTVNWNTYKFPAAKGSLSDTISVTHKSDGTADPITFELHGKVYISGDENKQGTLSLSTIPRETSITTFNVNQRDETSFTFVWQTADIIDYAWYSTDNGSTWAGYDVSDGTSGSFIVSKLSSDTSKSLSPNTSYNCKLRVRRKDSQLNTTSGTKQQTTYNYPYCTESPNFTIGNNVTLKFYNPLNRTMQIQMWSHTSQKFVSDLINVTGTSYTGFSNVASRLYASIPDSTASKYNIDVHYNNNKAVKQGGAYSINTNNCKPTFSNFTYQDTNGTTTALTGNNQIIVKGYSNIKTTVSTSNKAVAQNSATMKTYKTVIGSKSATANYSDSAEVNLNINNADNAVITMYATDSRSLSTSVSKTATIKNYSALTIKNVTATRSNNGVGKSVTLSFNGTFWNSSFGSVTNSISSIVYKYKETTSSTWVNGTTTLSVTASGSNWSGSASIKGDLGAEGFDITKSYDIRLQVSDRLLTKTFDLVLTSGTPAIAIYKNKVAIGRKYDSSLGGALQIDEKATAYSNIANTEVGFYAKRTDTNVEVWIGLGSGGTNHGVYSRTMNKWLIHGDGSKVYLDNISTSDIITKNNILNTVYPVGSIYMSVNATSPATLFGGTWSQLKDRFLLGAGDSYSNGATGGEATHKLTIDEIPSHNHQRDIENKAINAQSGVTGGAWTSATVNTGNVTNSSPTLTVTRDTGGGKAHNNMPPYLVVYMWKRTA